MNIRAIVSAVCGVLLGSSLTVLCYEFSALEKHNERLEFENRAWKLLCNDQRFLIDLQNRELKKETSETKKPN